MTEQNQTQLGKTFWNIADQLRGAMDAAATCREFRQVRTEGA
jgi:hypothetical protein